MFGIDPEKGINKNYGIEGIDENEERKTAEQMMESQNFSETADAEDDEDLDTLYASLEESGKEITEMIPAEELEEITDDVEKLTTPDDIEKALAQ